MRARSLLKNWKLSAIAVGSLSIALALGVLTISLLDALLLRPPAAADGGRLVMINTSAPANLIDVTSYPDFQYYRDNNHVFSGVTAFPDWLSVSQLSFENQDRIVLLNGVAANYFSVMGMRPFLGRLFVSGDENQAWVAVLTYACWKRWGSDPNIVGKTLPMNNKSFTIVGVAPREFTGIVFGLSTDLVVPVSTQNTAFNGQKELTDRDRRWFQLMGRLKPGVSRSQAEAEMRTLAQQLAVAYPKEDQNRTVVLRRASPLPPDMLSTAQLVSAILMGSVFLVVVVACANVANLLLTLATGRRQEALIKIAIGASRGRLIREFLAESVALCAISGALAYGIAAAVIAQWSSFHATLPIIGTFQFALNLKLDAAVVAFTVGLILLAGIATGIAPALYASSPNLAEALSGEGAVGGRRKGVIRNAIVIVQVALCTLALIGSGMCLRSLYNLRRVNPGFSARNIVVAPVFAKGGAIPEAQQTQFYETLRAPALSVYGVESVGLSASLPLQEDYNETPARVSDAAKPLSVAGAEVDGNYFSTLGIPLLAGRAFDGNDRPSARRIVIINHKLAETFWPGGEDPIERTIRLGDPNQPATLKVVTVVGVVGDCKYSNLDEPQRPFIYYPLSQNFQTTVNVIARTQGDPRLWAEPLVQALRKTDQAAPIPFLQPITMDTLMNLSLLAPILAMRGVSALSALGLLLAVVGIFGAISYSVSERRKELGIRVALGASSWNLLKMVFRQVLKTAGAGILAGSLLGIAGAAGTTSWFYRISVVEWYVLLPVSIAMLALSMGIAWLAARRWIRIDPMEAVRHM